MSITDKKWAQLAADEQFKRLEAIRGVASKWRDGLIAMTTLITTVTVIKAPGSTTDLSSDGKAIVAIAVGAALLLLLTGSGCAMRAAYGFPGAEELIYGERLREWTALQAKKAARLLRFAVVCFFAGVVLIGAAVAVTWFSSRNAAPVSNPRSQR